MFWRNCKNCTGSPEPLSQYQNLMYWLKWRYVAFMRAAKVLTSLFICSSELSSLDNAISNKNLTWWLQWRVVCHFKSMRAAKILASFHIFAKARLSLRHSAKISCAGSHCDVFAIYASSEGSGKTAQTTTATVIVLKKSKTAFIGKL